MSGKQKNKKGPSAGGGAKPEMPETATARAAAHPVSQPAAKTAPTEAHQPTAAGRGAVVAAAVLAIAALGWAMARVTDAAPPAEAAPALAVESLPGFRADAWFLPDDSLLGFVEVPEGLFLMGSSPTDSLAFTNERWADGSGPASVHAATFYIAKYEVTVAQLRAFVDATGYAASPDALRGELDHPAVSVSWPDALAYARWLEAQLKESPATPPAIAQLLGDGWHFTLPTEVQWEKAARGTDGRIFPWGNELRTDRANLQGTGTTRVGGFACSECAYGLADMSGNAWELTKTPFRDGPHDPRVDSADLQADALWVMRGGSYADPVRNVRAAVRGGADPGVRRPNIGFRLVLTK